MKKLALLVCMLLLLVVFIGPIFWFVLLAIRPADTFFTMPPVIAFTPVWDSALVRSNQRSGW